MGKTGYPNQKVYIVRQIFDKKTGEAPRDHHGIRMCGQAAIPHVLTKKALKMLELRKTDKKAFDKWHSNASWDEVWKRQETISPVVGQPMYFSSIKMDAGWYRTSEIQKIDKEPNGDLIVETVGSILKITEDV